MAVIEEDMEEASVDDDEGRVGIVFRGKVDVAASFDKVVDGDEREVTLEYRWRICFIRALVR